MAYIFENIYLRVYIYTYIYILENSPLTFNYMHIIWKFERTDTKLNQFWGVDIFYGTFTFYIFSSMIIIMVLLP